MPRIFGRTTLEIQFIVTTSTSGHSTCVKVAACRTSLPFLDRIFYTALCRRPATVAARAFVWNAWRSAVFCCAYLLHSCGAPIRRTQATDWKKCGGDD